MCPRVREFARSQAEADGAVVGPRDPHGDVACLGRGGGGLAGTQPMGCPNLRQALPSQLSVRSGDE